MKQWFYSENGKQLGPVDQDNLIELIQSGKLTAETFIWTDGMPEWGSISKSPFAELIGTAKDVKPSAHTFNTPTSNNTQANNRQPSNSIGGSTVSPRSGSQRSNQQDTQRNTNSNNSSTAVKRPTGKTTIQVKQQKEMLEAISGFETQNKYLITDIKGNIIAEAKESSSWIARHFLKHARPFTMAVTDGYKDIMMIERPFTFYLHCFNVNDANNCKIGTVERTFSLLRKNYVVRDASGKEIVTIDSPFWSPWTFKLLQNEVEVGEIKKKWSGFFKEGLTDADNFTVTFPAAWDGNNYKLILSAVLLIDFVHFEN